MEEWKPVPGYSYSASSLGRLRNMNTGRIVGVHKNKKGYATLPGILCHRLVAAAWLGLNLNDPSTVVDHIDGNKGNNAPSNLRLLSRREHAAVSMQAGQLRDSFGNSVTPLPIEWESTLRSAAAEVVTIQEAAKLLGRSTWWVRSKVQKLQAAPAPAVQKGEWRVHPEEPTLEFCSDGSFRDVLSKKRTWSGVSPKGYRKTRGIYIHRAVMLLFGPPQPGPGYIVRHNPDPNTENNAITNLEWGTYQDNGDDTVAHGRTRKGSRHPRTTLTEERILAARERYTNERWTVQQLADELGVPRTTAENLVRTGSSVWAHVPRPDGFDKKRMRREGPTHHLTHLNEEVLSRAFQLAGDNSWTADKFGEHLGLSTHTVRQIWKGMTWKTVKRPASFLALMQRNKEINERLTDAAVTEILQMAKDTGWGAPRLAKHFGKGISTIGHILDGTAYKHVPRLKPTDEAAPTPTSSP